MQAHLLVIRLSAMGDVAISVPAIRNLRHQHPDLKITILTKTFFQPFFRDIERLNFMFPDLKNEHKGVLGIHKLSKLIKSKNITHIADIHNVLRSNILSFFLFDIPTERIDKGRDEKESLVKGVINYQLKSSYQRYLDVFAKCGFPVDRSNEIFESRTCVPFPFLEELGKLYSTKKRIGIAPFAAYQSKMYPIDLMERVISLLRKDYDVFLFGGGAKEKSILESIANKYDNVISAVGKLNMDGELDLISHLDLMIAMDSGNAHIAAFMNIKVLTLWGNTHPYAGFYPYAQPDDYWLGADRTKYPKIPTSVFGKKTPEGYEDAMRSIKVEDVVKKVNDILKN